jgi:hypothetical protein
MSFFKKLSNIFNPQPPEAPIYWIYARCKRCGEIVSARVNLYNDVSIDYAEGGQPTYLCHKVLIGEKLCFQRIEVDLVFDSNRALLSREISGGTFVEGPEAS